MIRAAISELIDPHTLAEIAALAAFIFVVGIIVS